MPSRSFINRDSFFLELVLVLLCLCTSSLLTSSTGSQHPRDRRHRRRAADYAVAGYPKRRRCREPPAKSQKRVAGRRNALKGRHGASLLQPSAPSSSWRAQAGANHGDITKSSRGAARLAQDTTPRPPCCPRLGARPPACGGASDPPQRTPAAWAAPLMYEKVWNVLCARQRPPARQSRGGKGGPSVLANERSFDPDSKAQPLSCAPRRPMPSVGL